ncbi:MAG TPA: oligopeptide ABC transporter ATP-binding protein, partial [Thermotogota bacterium]|nr:oligopeptide ABC transporter ATP-binding protein [Thermotogota bacterium]
VCEPISGKVNRIKEVPIKGEVPSAQNIPQGCRFHPRCPYAKEECWKEEEPVLEKVELSHAVACRRFREI